MIFPFILIISSLVSGFEVAKYLLSKKLNIIDILGFSFPFGILINSIIGMALNSFLFCSIVHFTFQIAINVFIIMTFMKLNRTYRIRKVNVSTVCYLFIGFWILFLGYLSSIALFPRKDMIFKSSENDILFEVSLIASFVKGCNKRRSLLTSFRNPLLKGHKTFCEIIPIFYESILRVGGFSLRQSIFIPTFLLFASISILMFSYTYKLTNNQFLSVMAIPTLFFLGGFGFCNFPENKNIDFVFEISSSKYTQWGHPMLHNFLSMRISLMSLAVTLMVLILLENGLIYLSGILCVVEMFIKPQNGFALFIVYFGYNNILSFDKLKYFCISWIVLSLLFLPYFNIDLKKSLWNVNSPNSFLPLFDYLLSIFGFGFIVQFLSFKKENIQKIILFYGEFMFLSVVSLHCEKRFNFTTIQCVLVPIFVILICLGFKTILNLCKNYEIKGSIMSIIVFLFIGMWASSLLGIYFLINKNKLYFDEFDNDLAKWACENTKPKSVFAVDYKNSPIWNPVIVKAGRIALFSRQHTLIDFKYKEIDKINSFNNFMNSQVKENIDFDYILLTNKSTLKNTIEKNQLFKKVYQSKKYEVYKYMKRK